MKSEGNPIGAFSRTANLSIPPPRSLSVLPPATPCTTTPTPWQPSPSDLPSGDHRPNLRRDKGRERALVTALLLSGHFPSPHPHHPGLFTQTQKQHSTQLHGRLRNRFFPFLIRVTLLSPVCYRVCHCAACHVESLSNVPFSSFKS